MFYAYNFAQDKALEQAAIYGKIADDLEDKIHQYREHQIDVANATVSTLLGSARSLLFWVSTSAFAALMLIGPFGLTVMRGVLGRLKRITVYMSRLAKEPIGRSGAVARATGTNSATWPAPSRYSRKTARSCSSARCSSNRSTCSSTWR